MNNKKQYGQCWWGQAWLKLFSKACDPKCLQLGQDLATKGGLVHFLFNEKSVVETTVLGVGERQYQQHILFRPLKTTQQEALLEVLQQQPNLITLLLSQQLPTSFAKYLPKKLDDVHLACSCSDDKIPCKHLAASLFVLTEKIDQNPLFIFEMQGLNVLQKLEERGLVLPNNKSTEYLNLAALTNEYDQRKDCQLELVQAIDFSIIRNEWKAYLQLLSDETLFYSKLFKGVLQKNCRRAAKIYKERVFDRMDYQDWHQQLKQTKDVALVIDDNNQVINFFAINKGENQAFFAKDQVLSNLVGLLETVSLSDLGLYPDAFIALHSVYRFSMKLLQEQNFLPRMMSSSLGIWMQWIPAYNINKDIQAIVSALVELCPSDLLLLETSELKTFKGQEQILNLCHLFLSYYIQKASELIWTTDQDKQVEFCFFSGQAARFDNENLIATMDLWLQQLYMGQRDYAPVLKVLEDKEERMEFAIQLFVQNKKEDKAPLIDLKKFLQQKNKKKYHFEVLKELQRLGDFFPDLKRILAQEKTQTAWYSGSAFEQIFFKILPILRMLNIEVVLPRSLKQLTKPRLGLSIGQKKGQTAKGKSFMNAKSLLEVKWKIAIGEELIEAVEFFKMMKGQSGFVKHKEEYIHLDKEDLEKILLQLKSPPTATANQIIHAALSQEFDGALVEVQEEVKMLLNELAKKPLSEPPKTLKATLRPYQVVGYSWMFKNAQLGLGSLIADDMGLGKTLQVISLLLKFKEEGFLDGKQALVIVPTSLLTNWMNELAKFAPLLNPVTYHGAKRKLSLEADIIITTYGVARIDLTLLNQLDLYCTIIDEAQAIKNVNTAQTEAVKAIEAELNIAMSGTPVENRLSEYWSIMDYVNPNYLGSIGDFTETYSDPIEKDNDLEQLEAFRKITAPFILRRLKSDKSIIQDLPDKIETNYYANLQQDQAGLYKKVVDDVLHELAQLKQMDDAKKKRQGLILKLMGGLKQVCNHPYQYLRMGKKGPECSGKSQILMDLLTRIQLQQEKVLVFTQYRKMGNLMVEWIKERFGVEPMYLHGGCSRKHRDAMVEAFQHDKQQTIFILSLKAAGTGLNLTAANHVIHYDLWWNPAVENQATDRAYRIGQKKNVQVYRFISKGTMEEKIDAMIQSKKELANLTVSTGEQWLGNLSDDELAELVAY